MTCSMDTSVMAALQPGMLQQLETTKDYTLSHVVKVSCTTAASQVGRVKTRSCSCTRLSPLRRSCNPDIVADGAALSCAGCQWLLYSKC